MTLPEQVLPLTDRTALMMTAVKNHSDLLEALLGWGADPDVASTRSGDTALHFAALGGRLECARLLLDGGADHRSRNLQGKTALHYAQNSQAASQLKESPGQLAIRQVIPGIGAEGLSRRGPPAGPCRLFLGPGFRLAARCNRLGETVKTRKRRKKNGGKMGEIRPKTRTSSTTYPDRSASCSAPLLPSARGGESRGGVAGADRRGLAVPRRRLERPGLPPFALLRHCCRSEPTQLSMSCSTTEDGGEPLRLRMEGEGAR